MFINFNNTDKFIEQEDDWIDERNWLLAKYY